MRRQVAEYIIQAGGFDDHTNWGERTPLEALREQVGAVMGDRLDGQKIKTIEQAGEYLARGGQWAVANSDMADDLREVFGVEYSGERVFDLYCRLCGWAVAGMLRGDNE